VWIEKAFLASLVRRSVRTASDRGQLTMACGTGKRSSASSSPRRERTRTLVLVPSLSLLAQTLREWTAKRHARLRYLAVCSDETVVGEDAVVSRTCELPERGPNDAAR
jgi:predicted helicase